MADDHKHTADQRWSRMASGATQMLRPVVVGVDNTPGGQLALRWAVQTAHLRGLPLRVVRVADRVAPSFPTSALAGAAERLLVQESAAAGQTVEDFNRSMAYARDRLPADAISGLHTPGRPAAVLLHEARDAEMIVLGSRGRSAVTAALLGSVSATVAAHARCPVVVVRPARHETGARLPVVVGIDGSDDGFTALGFAFAEAAARGRPLRIVHCLPGLAAEAIEWDPSFTGILPGLPDELATQRSRYPEVGASVQLLKEDPAVALTEQSRDAELLVIGSRGRARLAGLLLGSVSQSLLHHAHCTVAVTHHDRP